MTDYFTQVVLEELSEDLEGNDWVADPDTPLAKEDAEGNAIPEPGDMPTYSEDDEGKFADQFNQAADRERELLNIVEMLQEHRGVSREMATSFQDVLPPGFALESFTAQPTNTNYVMSLEFIGTAIKVVAATAVVAVLGSIGYIVYRIVKFKKRLPNNKLDKAVSAAIATAEEKLKTAVTELSHTHPQLKHPEQVSWTKLQGLTNAAVTSGCQELDLHILDGGYKPLSEMAGPDTMVQAMEINTFFNKMIFPELDKMVRGGTGKDVEHVTQKVMDFKIEDRISKHLQKFGTDAQVQFSNWSEMCERWRTKYTANVPANEIESRLRNSRLTNSPMPEDAVSKMFAAQSMMANLSAKLHKYEKSLEKSKELPADYIAQMKDVLQKCKAPLSSLADVFTIVELEVASQKRCCKIKAMAVANGFKSVSEFYQEQAKDDKENASAYKDCANYLKKLFEPIKDALKQ